MTTSADRDRGGDRVFEIGSQQAGIINQAGRDQTILQSDGIYAPGTPLGALAELRDALREIDLDAASRRTVDRALDDVEDELDGPAPDKSRVAKRLKRVVSVLETTGALAGAAERLDSPLRHLAGWIGAAGASLIRMLG
jgi:hypothetical protein